MMKKMMHNTLAATGFAALLLVGACASNQGVAATDKTDDLVQVTQSDGVVPAPGPAKIDSDGNVYSSSASPGSGNSSSVGTNTNVNTVPQKSTVEVRESLVTTPVETTVVTEPEPVTPAPMISSAQETPEATPTRTRMRKD